MGRIILALLLLFQISCPQSPSDTAGTPAGGMTVAFIPKVTGNSFFEVANQGAQEFAKEWDITVSYFGSPSYSVANQVMCINDAIAMGVDAICISVGDADGLSDALKAAADAGIVVTTWDSDANVEDRALMVSQGTPEILGQMLVDLSVEGLKARGIDPKADEVKYAWHYASTVTDQNAWRIEGEKVIQAEYPNWVNVEPSNYYSEQDAEKCVTVGKAIFSEHPDIDLIICNDSTALPGQLEAALEIGLDKDDVTITGFATPNAIKPYCAAGMLHNWGLWDGKIQAALGCYLAAYLAAGNDVGVGDVIDIPGMGLVEVLPNDCLIPDSPTASINSGVVLLPERAVFTAENMKDYDF